MQSGRSMGSTDERPTHAPGNRVHPQQPTPVPQLADVTTQCAEKCPPASSSLPQPGIESPVNRSPVWAGYRHVTVHGEPLSCLFPSQTVIRSFVRCCEAQRWSLSLLAMASLSETLRHIAATRADDPLAPVTGVVPSHIAGLQLRRRLVQIGPFAGVRFETLPRIAEILGAARLAASGRSPLARPIADHVVQGVARPVPGRVRPRG